MLRSGNGFLLALFSLFLWGLWGFFQKLATNHINPRSVYIFAFLSTCIVVFFTLLSIGFRPELNTRGVLFALLAGLTGSLGGLFFVHSISRWKASIVITLTALYPVVTVLLSFLFLKEEITLKQGAGIVLALISMALLAS